MSIFGWLRSWKNIEISDIIRNVLIALYQPFWATVLMAFSSMFIYLYAKEHQWKIENFLFNTIKVWWNAFRSSSSFRRTFFLIFYLMMILFRTLLNRQIWFDSLGKIMGGQSLYTEEGALTTESIENFMLFVPFTVLLLWELHTKLFGNEVCLKKILWISFKAVGTFSLSIEFLQVLIHVGTFQLSDLCYNTLGGMFGGWIYWGLYRLKYKKKSTE